MGEFDEKGKKKQPPTPPPSVSMAPTPPPSLSTAPTPPPSLSTAPTPPPSLPGGLPPTPTTAEMTKLDVIAKTPELKKFYDTYHKLPLAPTEGEGSKYKTPEDFKKLTHSAVKPPTRDTSTHLSKSDRTAVEVSKAALGEQFVEKKMTKEQKQERKDKIESGEIIKGPDRSILGMIAEKLMDVLNSITAAVVGVDVKQIYEAGKAMKDAKGAGDKFMAIIDLGFVIASNGLSLLGKASDLIAAVEKALEVVKLPIVSSILAIAMGVWNWIKNAKEISQISKRSKFLNDKQKAFKKKRFDELVTKQGITLSRKDHLQKKVVETTPDTDIDAIKKQQKEELKQSKITRKDERAQRRIERKKVLESRLAGVTDPKKRKEIQKQMDEETVALRKMREEGRKVVEREHKQQLKDARMLAYAREHSGEQELKRQTRFLFFDKGDGTKEEDYKLNDDKVRSDVFIGRSKTSRTEDEEKQLEEDEEIIANFRAQEVLQTRLRGQIISAVATGFSITGEGISLAAELMGLALPVGTVVSGVGTALELGNAAFNALREALGNLDDTTQGKRYLDRSSEVNLLLRKSDETRTIDESLGDADKGPTVEEFSQKYWETKKYMHAYGVDMEEAVHKRNPTKYHVVKYMMDAVAKT